MHDRYHIGIATATPQGLLVPVIRDADRKDLARSPPTSSAERRSPAGRRGWKDLRGGTFTYVNRGSAACWRRRSSTIPR